MTNPFWQPDPLTPPPPLAPDEISLALDFDGTLVELAEQPDAVVVDGMLTDLLGTLADRLAGRLAIVSGRSIAQLEGFLGPIAGRVALAGSHGIEQRWPGATAIAAPDPAVLAPIRAALAAFAAERPGVVVEEKSHGAALHYRQAPHAEAEAQALIARLAGTDGFVVQPGKMMAELRIGGGDKGAAVRALAARPEQAGTRPFFIGDDVTDEAGFAAAAALGGAGVLVGPVRDTAARHVLPNVAATRAWLAALME